MNERIYEGTKVKYRIEIESQGFNMATDDFTITLISGTVKKVYRKSDLIEKTVVEDGIGVHQYYLCFDTSFFGSGDIFMQVEAFVPDSDFPGGIRNEVDRFRLVNVQQL